MDSLWDFPDFDAHERVLFVTDRESGLRAIIAIHSTHLGPGAGGTRFWHYARTGDAVADALRLSRGMSYKNAMAGLPMGGGKAVILADEARTKTPEMLAAYGRAVDGLAEACRALGAPVVGGNVSLYNETPQGPIYPTPVVGMVGELPDPERAAGEPWREGDSIALVGPFDPSLAGSELEKLRGQLGKGLPAREIGPVRAAIELVRDAVRTGAVRTATDVSDGGVATTLAELAIGSGLGCRADLQPVLARRECSPEDALFGEGPGGFILAGEKTELEKLAGRGIDLELIGDVTGNEVVVEAAGSRVEILVDEAAAAFDSLEERIESDQAGLTH